MEYESRTHCSETALMIMENSTCVAYNDLSSNGTSFNQPPPESSLIDTWIVIVCFVYGIICLAGTLGNGLVVYVVVRYTKMRSVPNMYVFNLAISDICFLVMLPFLIVTALRKMWVFGEVLCKLFYIMTSLNWFASVFTLIVMSADRYMAVCHPVSSIRYRTPGISLFVCLSVWVVSTLFMLPICLYAEAVEESGVKSCTIQWPETDTIPPDKAFIWYAMLIGFAVPMVLISAFYVLVVLRLKTCGPKRKSGQPRRTPHSHRRVTRMVLAVVTVHVVCWLPYWVFQVVLTFQDDEYEAPAWQILAFQFATIFSYTNSVFNPLLYAFLGDNFRQTFAKSITCQRYDVRLATRASDMSARSNRTTTRSSQNTDSDRKREAARAKADQDNRHPVPPAAEVHALLALPAGETDKGVAMMEEDAEPSKHGRRRHHHHRRHVSSLSAISLVEDLNRNHGNSAPDAGSFQPEEGAAPIEAGLHETEF